MSANACDICGHKARSKRALDAHRRKDHAIVAAADDGDRLELLRALVRKLAREAEDASVREIPSVARQLVLASEAVEDALGRERSIAQLQAEVERLRRTHSKEKTSRVDEIAERRARRRSKTASR